MIDVTECFSHHGELNIEKRKRSNFPSSFLSTAALFAVLECCFVAVAVNRLVAIETFSACGIWQRVWGENILEILDHLDLSCSGR